MEPAILNVQIAPPSTANLAGALQFACVHAFDLKAEYRALHEHIESLSSSERNRAANFRFDADRHRFVITRGCLRRLLGLLLRAAPHEVAFATNDYGKPVLADAFAGSSIQFNVAHSADVAVIGVARGAAIGVDVEQVRDVQDADALVTRYFSPRERIEFESLPAHARTRAFFCGWTRKEAVVKALGLGLSYPLDQFDISLHPDLEPQLIRLGNDFDAQRHWSLHSYVPQAGYIAAVAVQRPHPAAAHRNHGVEHG